MKFWRAALFAASTVIAYWVSSQVSLERDWYQRYTPLMFLGSCVPIRLKS